MYRVICRAAAVSLCLAAPASAQIVLTFDETLARAREQAPAVAVARARIPEAEATILDAAVRVRQNPEIEVAAGPRSGPDAGRQTDFEVGLSQWFETGGQRRARLGAARATVDRAQAEVQLAARGAVFEAANAFLDGVAAGERLRLAEEADAVSRNLLRATERRYAAGDIAAIDLNLSRIEAARTGAELVAARADLTVAIGTLRAVLRLPDSEPVELRGTLDPPPLPPLGALESRAEERPEIGALSAELREAEAQARLGRALSRPDLGLRVAYEREERDTVLIGGFTVTLPAFQRGRGTQAAGIARAGRARAEQDAFRQATLSELRAAYEVHRQRALLADTLAQTTGPVLADNEALGQRSYEAGEMNLMDFLLIRRDALETRGVIIDRRLEAARSRLEVDFIAGVLR